MDIDFQNIDEPIKMSLEDFMSYYGVSSPVSDFLIDKLKGNRQIKTSNGMKKFENDAKNAREEYYKKRQDIIDEYYSLVNGGKIIPKMPLEKSLSTARGHFENDSVQAARRMCLKQGVNWLNGKEISLLDKEIIDTRKHMTHNEYSQYKKECAYKLSIDKDYTLDDFNRDFDSVEVIGYDLEKYNLSKDIEDVINCFTDRNDFKESSEAFYGHINLQNTWGLAEKLNCVYGIPYKFSGYMRNNEDMIILNYAEGDISINVYTDKNQYNQDVIETHNFYDKESFYILGENVWTASELANEIQIMSNDIDIKFRKLNLPETVNNFMKEFINYFPDFFDSSNPNGINKILIAHPGEPEHSSRWSVFHDRIEYVKNFNPMVAEEIRPYIGDVVESYSKKTDEFKDYINALTRYNVVTVQYTKAEKVFDCEKETDMELEDVEL